MRLIHSPPTTEQYRELCGLIADSRRTRSTIWVFRRKDAVLMTKEDNPNRFPFDKKTLERKKTPDSSKKFIIYHDTNPEGKGLQARHYSSGQISFCMRTRIDGREYFFKLGTFPSTSVSKARHKLRTYKTKIEDGEHPEQDRTAEALRVTVNELFNKYISRHAIPNKRPISIREDKRQYKNHVKTKWGNRRLASIRNVDFLELYFKIGETKGPYAANRLLALLSTMFNKAITWGLYLGPNPAKVPSGDKYKEKKRARFLNRDELTSFFSALENEPNTTARDLFYVLIMTGARVNDGLSMRWVDIDLISRHWRIPDPKGGETYTVPLVAPLWGLLVGRLCDSIGQSYPGHWARIGAIPDPAKQLEKTTTLITALNKVRIAAKSPYVFPGDGASGHYAEPKSAWKRVM